MSTLGPAHPTDRAASRAKRQSGARIGHILYRRRASRENLEDAVFSSQFPVTSKRLLETENWKLGTAGDFDTTDQNTRTSIRFFASSRGIWPPRNAVRSAPLTRMITVRESLSAGASDGRSSLLRAAT